MRSVGLWVSGALLGLVAMPVAFLFVALYVYAPLKVRREQGKNVEPNFEPIDPGRVPPEVAAAFWAASPGLVAAGFGPVGHARTHAAASGQDGYVSVCANPAAGDTAQLIAVRTPQAVAAGGGVQTTTLATIRTDFEGGGRGVATSNTGQPGCFPPDPAVDFVAYPGVSDLALLYRVHRARAARDAGGRRPTLSRVAAGAAQCLRLEWDELFGRLARLGYYRLDPARGRYEMTLKGAYLATYRLLWPFQQMQLASRARKADRVLRELGFGDLQTLRDRQPQLDPRISQMY